MRSFSVENLRRGLLAGLALAAVLGGASPALAQSKPASRASQASTSNDAEAVELLRAIEQRHGKTQTVSGQFEQTREVPDSPDDAIKSVALFYLQKPNKFRADYLKPGEQPATDGYPYRTTNLIVGRDSFQYVRELDQINHYKFRNDRNVRDFNYLLLGFGAHTEELLQVYRVKSLKKTPKGYRGVELIPLNPSDAGFESISMLVTSDEQLLPAEFTMVQADGSRQKVRLHTQSLRVGAPVEKSVFEKNFPRSAETIPIN